MTMLPITYGYARVSKADDSSKNLDTQLRLLAHHGIREDLIFTDVASGRSLARSGWQGLMDVVQTRDTIAVAFLDPVQPQLRGGSPHPGRPDRPGHRHRGYPGEHRHPGLQRRRQVLPEGHAGPGRLPGGRHQRADPGRAGPGPGRGTTHRPTSRPESGTGGGTQEGQNDLDLTPPQR